MFKKINPSTVKWLGFFVAALAIFVSLPEFATMQSQTKLDFKDPRKTGVSASVAKSREQATANNFDNSPVESESQTNAQSAVSNDIVISQIYDGGGLLGATYQNRYFEIFNRGNAAVDFNAWVVQFGSPSGSSFNASTSFVSLPVQPGQYRLIQVGASGPNGAALPAPDLIISPAVFFTSPFGKVALTRPGTSQFLVPCPLPNSNVVDFVGFGSTANCFEGSAPTANLSVTTAAIRLNNGCTDTDNNASDFSIGAPNPRNGNSPFNPCPASAPSISISNVSLNEGNGGTTSFTFNVTLSSQTSQTVTVNYATANGSAASPTDYQAASGTLTFNPNETGKQITVLVNGDTTVEPNENFFVNLSNPTNATIGDNQGEGTIVNDDAAGGCTLSSNIILDGGYEATTNMGTNPNWISTSTRFGTSLCTVTGCGTGGGAAAPRGGNGWVWFDGTGMTAAENGTAQQTVTLPAGATVSLSYYLKIGTVTAPSTSVLTVQVDNTTVQTITEPATAETAYTQRAVNLSPFANGAARVIRFSYSRPAGATGSDNFTIDDVTLAITACPTQQPARKQFDFDGDGKADYGVFRPSNGVWYLQNSTAGFYGAQFGISTDKIAPADFDGDGKTDIAVFRAGIWHILGSQTGYSGIQFGQAGDIPVPGDFDGDGKADPAVYRGGVWHILRSQSGYTGVQFGVAADKPVAADYDGDGRTDPAVARQTSGLSVWHILGSNQGYTGVQFGIETDKLVPADYDGDGKTDPAVYRGGTWYLLRSQLGFTGIQFGIAEDKTAAGDYDGDGKADVAVWRPSSGVFHVLRSQTGYTGVQFGQNADLPVASAFVP